MPERWKTVASTQVMGLGSCPVNMLTILLVGSFLYLHIAQGPITNLQRPLQETHGVGMSVLSQLKWMPWVYPKHCFLKVFGHAQGLYNHTTWSSKGDFALPAFRASQKPGSHRAGHIISRPVLDYMASWVWISLVTGWCSQTTAHRVSHTALPSCRAQSWAWTS